jgi:hypothetical protein
MNGEGDMALQLESEISPHKEVELVGSLPDDLAISTSRWRCVHASDAASARLHRFPDVPACATESKRAGSLRGPRKYLPAR